MPGEYDEHALLAGITSELTALKAALKLLQEQAVASTSQASRAQQEVRTDIREIKETLQVMNGTQKELQRYRREEMEPHLRDAHDQRLRDEGAKLALAQVSAQRTKRFSTWQIVAAAAAASIAVAGGLVNLILTLGERAGGM